MIALALNLAYGADAVVIYAGDPDAAVQTILRDTDLEVWRLHPVTATHLVGAPIGAVGTSAIRCEGKPLTNSALRGLVEAAEKRILYDEHAGAASDLDRAAADLPCLTEPAEASLQARLFYLRGVAASAQGDEAAAKAAFARALGITPDLKWDEDFPPDWQAPFDASKSTETLPVGLAGASTGWWIDGHAANGDSIALRAGPHLVQRLSSPSGAIVVDVAPGTVLIAGDSLTDALIERIADPSSQSTLAIGLAASSADAEGYVVSADRVYRIGTPGSPATELPMRTAAARHESRRRAVSAGGIALAVLGSGIAATGAGLWATAPADDGTIDGFDARTDRQTAGSALFTAGIVTVGVGGATLVVGRAL